MAVLGAIYSGTSTLANGSATLSVSLGATIDLTKSFEVATWRINSGSPQNCSIDCVLTTTTIDFTRSATSTDCIIDWFAAAFTSGVTAQRGVATNVGSTPTNVTISSVNTAKAWPIISDSNAGTGYGTDDTVRARITSGTNLALQAGASGADRVPWQVVEDADCSVQEVLTTFSTETQIDTTITSAATNKTAVFSSLYVDGSVVGGSLPILFQTSATNLRAARFHTAPGVNVASYVVTFSDATTCEQKQVSFTSSDTSIITSITSVTTANTVLVGAGSTEASNGYSNSTASGGNLAAMFGNSLTSSTQVTTARAATGSVAGTAGFTVVQFPTASGVSGTVAYTNANDTSAASGTTTVTGTLARTNANDTSAASGTTTITGSLARTNANDTSAASGSPTIVGSSSTTNASDTSAASGTTTVTGSLARTNANDTSSASGSPIVNGSSATANANDSASAAGSPVVNGQAATTNANDTCAASGTAGGGGVSGTVNYTNANDTSAGSGTTTIKGTLARTNANDTCAASGVVVSPVSGTVSYTNRNDTCAAEGETPGPPETLEAEKIPYEVQVLDPSGHVSRRWFNYFQNQANRVVSGAVNYVSGTPDRIVVGGAQTNPVIDISPDYEGQESIQILGEITTGAWMADVVAVPYGGTGAASLTSNAVLYGGGIGPIQATPLNTTGTAKFLSQVSSGVPTWEAITITDLPTITLTGDVTGAGAGGTIATTIGANKVTDAMFRQSAALSVVGRSANSSGNVADISTAAGSGLFLRESGSALVFGAITAGDLPGGFAGFANPTATIGLTAVNGSATTAMRSDAAPALSQSISPTWTGTHTFTTLVTASAGVSVSGLSTLAALTTSGTNTLSGLSGSGTRLVTASATGDLGATSASSFGLVSGSGTAGRVAYWDGTSSLTSSDKLRFTDSGAAGSELTLGGGVGSGVVVLSGGAASSKDLQWNSGSTGGSGARWTASSTATADDWQLTARDGSGVVIDNPITIVRSSAGAIGLGGATARPVNLSGALNVTGLQTNASDLAFSASSALIRSNANTKSLEVNGGGASGTTNGASIRLYGVDASSNQGLLVLASGQASEAGITLKTSGVTRSEITSTGSTYFYGDVYADLTLNVTGQSNLTGNVVFGNKVTNNASHVSAHYNVEASATPYFQANNGVTVMVRLSPSGAAAPYNYFNRDTILGTDATPSYKLDVRGTFGATGASSFASSVSVTGDLTVANATSSGPHFILNSTDTGGREYWIVSGGSENGAFPTGALTIRDVTAGANRLTISNAGLVNVPGAFSVTGAATFTSGTIIGDVANAYFTGQPLPYIYGTNNGGSAPFNASGHLILQPRTSAARDIILVTSDSHIGARFFGAGTISLYDATTVNNSLSVTGNLTFSGFVGHGSAPSTSMAYNLQGALAYTDNSQFGFLSRPTFNSLATSSGSSFYAQVCTQAASYTMANGYALFIESANKGSGSTITNLYGIRIQDVTAGSNNWAIYTNAGQVHFGGSVDASGTLDVTGNVFASGAGSGFWMNTLGTFTYGFYTSGGNLLARSGSTSPFLSVSSSGVSTFLNTVVVAVTPAGGGIIFRNTNDRWNHYVSGTESGGNAGSTYRLAAYTDGGSFIDNVISLERASGGAMVFGGSSGRPLEGTGNFYTSGSGTGYWLNSPGTNTYGMYTSGTNLLFRSGSGTPFLTVNSSGQMTVANAATFSSTVQIDGNLTVGTNAGSARAIVINGAAGSTKYVETQSAGVTRWLMISNNDAESSTATGSNWELRAYTNAGAYIDSPFNVTRAAGGTITIPRPIAATSTLTVTSTATFNAGRTQFLNASNSDLNIGTATSGNDRMLFGWDPAAHRGYWETVTTSYPLAIQGNGGRLVVGSYTEDGSTNFQVVGTAKVSGLITAGASVSVADSTGIVTTISASTRTLIARSGTTLNIGENGGWTGINYRLPSGAAHAFQVNGTSWFSIDASSVFIANELTMSGSGSDITFTHASAHTVQTTNGNLELVAGGNFSGNDRDLILVATYGNPSGQAYWKWYSRDGEVGGTTPDELVMTLHSGSEAGLDVEGYGLFTQGLTVEGLSIVDGIQAQDVIEAQAGLELGAFFKDHTGAITSSTTLSAADSAVLADASGGAFTLTLPAASGNAGLTYTILKSDTSTNTVTVDGSGSETIGGALTVVLAGNTGNSRLVIICNGSNWLVKELHDEGTYTATLTGVTTSVTGTARFVRDGSGVTLYLPVLVGTSNATSATITGLPPALRPARVQFMTIDGIYDAGNSYTGAIGVRTDGVIDVYYRNSLTALATNTYSAAGSKGVEPNTTQYSML